MSVRTLFIGLDGATFTALDPLLEERPGEGVVMPFLKRLLEQGARARLRSTPNPLTPPAWVSLMTGRSPGHHGVFDFIRAEEHAEQVYFTLYDARDVRSETIWSIAGRHGLKVAALNFPFTAPPPPGEGFFLPGFIPWKHLKRNSAPKGFYERLKALPDFDPKELAWDFDREKQSLEELDDAQREQWVRYHLPREAQWQRIAAYLIEQEAPELMAVLFDGVDKLQHQAWRFIDPTLAATLATPYERRMRELCLHYFRQLDGAIEQLVTLAGPQAQVFLASDHGFTATTEVVRINAYLHQKGWLQWRAVGDSEQERRREASLFANLDWQQTIAYCRTPSSNGITIRVARRDGEGGVRPEEYEAVRERLIADLRQLKDAAGAPVIAEIHKREAVFPGPAMADAPDLLLVLRDRGFVSIKNRLPVVEPRAEPAGTHHPDGVFMAAGPGIRRGVELGRRPIVDVAATLLYSLGLPIPADFEGKVADKLFAPDHLQAHPIRRGAPTSACAAGADGAPAMAAEDKDQVLGQLRLLGYME